MPKYTVVLTRTTEERARVEIEADSQLDAETQAETLAENVEYGRPAAEWVTPHFSERGVTVDVWNVQKAEVPQ